jgi:hypothetical protein
MKKEFRPNHREKMNADGKNKAENGISTKNATMKKSRNIKKRKLK